MSTESPQQRTLSQFVEAIETCDSFSTNSVSDSILPKVERIPHNETYLQFLHKSKTPSPKHNEYRDHYANAAIAISKDKGLNNNMALKHTLKDECGDLLSPYVNRRHVNGYRHDKKMMKQKERQKKRKTHTTQTEANTIIMLNDDTPKQKKKKQKRKKMRSQNPSFSAKAVDRAYRNNLDVPFAKELMSTPTNRSSISTVTPTNNDSMVTWENTLSAECLRLMEEATGEVAGKYIALFAVLSTNQPTDKYNIVKNVYKCMTETASVTNIVDTMIKFF